MIRKEEREKANLSETFMEFAKYDYASDRLIPAVVMACEALVTELHFLCESHVIDLIVRNYYQSSKPFDELEYSDWISYLRQIGVISLQEMLDFSFLLKDYYNSNTVSPFVDLTDDKVVEIMEIVYPFIKKNNI